MDASKLDSQWDALDKSEKALSSVGLDETTTKAVEHFRLWMEQKRYSPQTVKNYLSQFIQFLKYHQPRSYKEILTEDVARYNHQVILKQGLSVSYQRGMVGSIKLFYSQVQDTKMNLYKLQRPFNEQRLPEVLSKEEVQQLLQVAPNL